MPYPLTVIQPTDLVRDSRADLNNNFYTLYTLVTATSAGSGSGGSTNILVNQTGHGLSAGQVIRLSATNVFVTALADSPQNAEAVGIVRTINNPNEFVYTQTGVTTFGVPAVSAGTVLFLSNTVAGALTATEPTQAGSISKPMAIVLESGVSMEILSMRGFLIGGTAIDAQATLNNANSPYYITGNDCFLDIDASVSAVTAILPTAVNAGGKFYVVTKVDNTLNPVTILTTSNQTINGFTSAKIQYQYTSLSIHSNNSNWLIH
jgi:hypothetical protein